VVGERPACRVRRSAIDLAFPVAHATRLGCVEQFDLTRCKLLVGEQYPSRDPIHAPPPNPTDALKPATPRRPRPLQAQDAHALHENLSIAHLPAQLLRRDCGARSTSTMICALGNLGRGQRARKLTAIYACSLCIVCRSSASRTVGRRWVR
jgi:hypothetical protein